MQGLYGSHTKSRLEYRGLFASLDEKIDDVADSLQKAIKSSEERIQILERKVA